MLVTETVIARLQAAARRRLRAPAAAEAASAARLLGRLARAAGVAVHLVPTVVAGRPALLVDGHLLRVYCRTDGRGRLSVGLVGDQVAATFRADDSAVVAAGQLAALGL